jgi:hypothetical protein
LNNLSKLSDCVNPKPDSHSDMWRKFAASSLALGSFGVAAAACAMSAPGQAQGPCRVSGGDKLPAQAGGADAICAAIERAVAAGAPNVRYSADVRVLSRSALAAELTVNGRKLPELRFSVSDRELNPVAFGHFAESVATALAQAGRR